MKPPQPEDLKRAALELAWWENRAKFNGDRSPDNFQADIRAAHATCRKLIAKLTRDNTLTQKQCLHIISKAKIQIDEESRVEAYRRARPSLKVAQSFAARRAFLGIGDPN